MASVTLGHVSLSWIAPSSNGGSLVTSYKICRGAAADPETHVQVGTAIAPAFDDSQIIVGQTYYYSVRAVNIVGSSVSSNVVSVLAKGLASAPVALITQISDRSVLLSWSEPTSDGFSAITGYKVYRSMTPGTGTLAATVTGSSFTDNGLVNGELYYYRVSAVNAMGEGPLSSEVYDSPATVPAAPAVAEATFSIGNVDLTWSSMDDGGRTISWFSVYRGSSPDFASASLMAEPISGYAYQDPTAAVGSTYYYFVTATSSMGTSGPGSSGPLLISIYPSAPVSVAATVQSDHIQLSWSPPPSSGSSLVSGYYVYRALSSGGGTVIAHLGDVMAYSDTAVSLGQVYYYCVKAENQNGSGPLSAEVHAIYAQVPGSPTELTVAGAIGNARLTWSAPAQNGAPILGYTVRAWTTDSAPSVVAQAGADSSSALISGLINGVQYWFTVAASNLAGEGSPSSSATCWIGTVPSAPSAISASQGNGTISISWAPPTSNGGIAGLNYQLWRSSTGGSTLIASLDGSARTYVDGSVIAGTAYHYSMAASNSIGSSPMSGPVDAYAATVPGAPSLVVVEPGVSSILVVWTVPEDGGSSLSGFAVYRSAGAGWQLLSTLSDPSTTAYRDQTVVGGISYQYRVAAINSVGEGFQSSGSPYFSTISVPSTFGMEAYVGDSNVTLAWDMPSSHGTPLLGFTIVRTEIATGTVTMANVSSSGSVFTDNGVIPGKEYLYQIIAFNAAGSVSTGPVSVRSLRNVTIDMRVVPFQNSISVSGVVANLSGNGIGGQTVTIYLSTSMSGDWTEVGRTTTTASGKFSSLLSASAGIIRLMAVLSDDGTHGPISIEQTVGSLRLRNGDLASISSNSVVSGAISSSTEDRITFSLEQTGTANVTIPKNSVSSLDMIGVTIGGRQGSYRVTETDDQYIFTLFDVEAGQIISLSIGQASTDDNIPTMAGLGLLFGACACAFIYWRGRSKERRR